MKVVHCKKEKYDVYIGRPSKWGNPYSHQRGTLAEFLVDSRQEAIAKYEQYVRATPELLAALPELNHKILGCWCKPLPCHGDVLVSLVKELRPTWPHDHENCDQCGDCHFCSPL